MHCHACPCDSDSYQSTRQDRLLDHHSDCHPGGLLQLLPSSCCPALVPEPSCCSYCCLALPPLLPICEAACIVFERCSTLTAYCSDILLAYFTILHTLSERGLHCLQCCMYLGSVILFYTVDDSLMVNVGQQKVLMIQQNCYPVCCVQELLGCNQQIRLVDMMCSRSAPPKQWRVQCLQCRQL